MEYYDVIIVGGGIAGCGLAYNLSKIAPRKKVLMIDSRSIGGNAAYGQKSTFESVIKEYKFPVKHKIKGIKVGVNGEIVATLPGKFYAIDYKKVCNFLFKQSQYKFKKERGLNVKKNILETDKKSYRFKYLIDCSGHNFFLRKLFKKPMPNRFWIGRTKILKRDKNSKLEEGYIYYSYGEDEYFEDAYVAGDKVLQGDWVYAKKMNEPIPPQKDSLFKRYCKKEDIIKEHGVVIPVTPVLPLTFKDYAFLGDSFGNAVPVSVFGVETTLKTSKLLATAIKKEDLGWYEKTWIKNNLNIYLKRLCIKYDTHLNPKFVEKIKRYPKLGNILRLCEKYPQFYIDMLQKQYIPFDVPKGIRKKYPSQRYVWLLGYYIFLKLKYLKMRLFDA